MSIKAYDLYRWEGKDMLSLQEWLRALREQYIASVCQTLNRFVVPRFPHAAFEKLVQRVESDTAEGLRSPFNIEASAVVYLHPSGAIYVQFFGVPEWIYEKDCNELLRDTHYQDQSDQPDDVSDEAWEERRNIVEALIGDSSPSHAGFVFTFANTHDIRSLCYRAVTLQEA